MQHFLLRLREFYGLGKLSQDDNSLFQRKSSKQDALDLVNRTILEMMKDCHKLFLQSFMSRGILEAKEVKQLFRTVCLKYKENLPDTEEERLRLLPAFVRTINDNVKPFHMEIKKGISEEDGISYYCLVNTTQSSYCKFSSDYSASELEFYKKLIEVIVNSEDGQVSSTDALNLTSTLKEKKMSKDAAQQLLKRLENDKWIKLSRGKICLATRSLLEMEMYILDTYKDDVDKCNVCNKLCIKGDSCSSCGTKLHFHCAKRFFHGRDSAVCPKQGCEEPWPHTYGTDGPSSSQGSTSRKRKEHS